jgi:hypothetical protein
MPLYNISREGLFEVQKTSFQSNGILERDHLQKFLREKINVISNNTLVISEEFSYWEDSKKRIDLLGIDKDANLVVIELKRNDTGDHMELQALRYASMISTMNFEKCCIIYQEYLNKNNIQKDAKHELMFFLEWEIPLEDDFASNVKIILASANFSKELTTSVMWLLTKGLDITCIKLEPYFFKGEMLIDISQIIPLPEAESYLIKIKEKTEERNIALRSNRDKTKYNFNSLVLGKGRLVFEVVKHHTNSNPHLTFTELQADFPAIVQGSTGIINSIEFINKKYEGSSKNRHFTDEKDILISSDGVEFAVSTEWGIGNINNFIDLAESKNYQIVKI